MSTQNPANANANADAVRRESILRRVVWEIVRLSVRIMPARDNYHYDLPVSHPDNKGVTDRFAREIAAMHTIRDKDFDIYEIHVALRKHFRTRAAAHCRGQINQAAYLEAAKRRYRHRRDRILGTDQTTTTTTTAEASGQRSEQLLSE